MTGYFEHTLALLDEIYARFRKDSFPVGEGPDAVSSQVAEELRAGGYVRLTIHPDVHDIGFRAVPAHDSPAPYRLIPFVPVSHDEAPSWLGSLTRHGLALVAAPIRISTPSFGTITLSPRPGRRGDVGLDLGVLVEESRALPRLVSRPAAMHVQSTLDAGGWGPEQSTIVELVEMLAPTRHPTSGKRVKRRGGFFGR